MKLILFDFSVDKEKNKCQMKLTDQFIEQVVSKRGKRNRLSRNNSLVRNLENQLEYFHFLRSIGTSSR